MKTINPQNVLFWGFIIIIIIIIICNIIIKKFFFSFFEPLKGWTLCVSVLQAATDDNAQIGELNKGEFFKSKS